SRELKSVKRVHAGRQRSCLRVAVAIARTVIRPPHRPGGLRSGRQPEVLPALRAAVGRLPRHLTDGVWSGRPHVREWHGIVRPTGKVPTSTNNSDLFLGIDGSGHAELALSSTWACDGSFPPSGSHVPPWTAGAYRNNTAGSTRRRERSANRPERRAINR